MKNKLLFCLIAAIPYTAISGTYNNEYLPKLTSTTIDNNNEYVTFFDYEKSIIIDNNSSSRTKEIDKSKADSINTPKDGRKTYEDVDIEILENEKGTQVIVHKKGDTIQHFEMNFDKFNNDTKNHALNEEIDKATLADTVKSQKKENNTLLSVDLNALEFPKKSKKKKSFKGNWSGFEVGLNNYLTADNSLSPDESYMEINTGKSWNFNLNFAQVSLPIYQDRIGFVSGLGIEWCNYHFSNKNTIAKDVTTHRIESKDLSNNALKKNRLQTTYLTAPLLLEIQLGGENSKRVALSGGVIAGLKLGSHTKYKTGDNKEKSKDDFYLNSFRYGFTARIHYDDIGLYFNYYNTPLFMNSKGPQLYPFAAGVILSFN